MKVESFGTDVILYICHNCYPQGSRLPRQWTEGDVHVKVKEIPCSGKIDIQYIFHALEGGARGVCVVACPQGECTLAQGNYRAEIRVSTVRKLLAEIGLEPERVGFVHFSPEGSYDSFRKLLDDEVQKFSDLKPNPITA